MISTKIWNSDVAENTNLVYNKTPFKFHSVDRSILRVSNKAINNEKYLAINYPLHNCDLIVPMTLEACYTLINKEGKRKKVLLITNKLFVREFYSSIEQAGGKISSVLFPIGMVSRNGSIKPIYDSLKGLRKKYKDYINDSMVLLSNSLKYLPSDTSEIGSIIFDLTQNYEPSAIQYVVDWAKLQNIKAIVFITSDMNVETLSEFQNKDISIWAWTPTMLKQEFSNEILLTESCDAPFYNSAIEVQRIIKGLRRDAVFVEIPERLERMFLDSYKFLKDVKQMSNFKSNHLLQEALRTYIKIIKLLEWLPASLNVVEEEEEVSWGVLSIEKRFQKLKSLQQKISEDDPILASLLENAISNINRIKDWFYEHSNLKFEKVIELIEQNKTKKIIFVVFRNCDKKAMLYEIKSKLNLDESDLESKNIIICSYSEIDSILGLFDELYILGKVPNYAKFLTQLAFPEKITFILYPYESLLVQRQLEKDDLFKETEFDILERAHAIANLLNLDFNVTRTRLENEYKNIIPPKNINLIALPENTNVKLAEVELTNDLLDFEDSFELTTEMDSDYELNYDFEDSLLNKEGVVVLARRIDFDDGESIFVPNKKRLSYFIEYKDKLINKESEKTKIGDIILIVDRGTKENLTQSMFKVLHKLPSLKKTLFLVQSWSSVLNKEMKKNNYGALDVIKKLEEEGSQIREQLTIVHWLLGETMGPRDKKDIYRLGKIFNNEFLINNFSIISNAVTALRGIHQKVIRRLSLLIPRAGMKAIKGDFSDEDMISSELGLHVEDFYDSISLKKVKHVKEININYSLCNKLLLTKEIEQEGVQND